jgi:hypothetical protein
MFLPFSKKGVFQTNGIKKKGSRNLLIKADCPGSVPHPQLAVDQDKNSYVRRRAHSQSASLTAAFSRIAIQH